MADEPVFVLELIVWAKKLDGMAGLDTDPEKVRAGTPTA